jgi:hypothetical protein
VLEVLKEPELYDEFIEKVIIATNPAIERILERIAVTRDERNTCLLRVIRNTASALAFKGRYRGDDSLWEELSARL